MVTPRVLVLFAAVFLSGCASSSAAAVLRSNSGSENTPLQHAKWSGLNPEQTSLLQQFFGVRPVAKPLVQGDEDGEGGFLIFVVGFILGAVVCGLLPILGYAVSRALGKRIERGVEAYNKAQVGVDMDIGKLSVNLCEGYILVHGLTVFNPPGYSAEYLLKAETVSVDVRMATLVCSCFRTVQVEKVVFSGVDVLYDKSWSSSNIHDVMNGAGREKAVEKTERREAGAKCTVRKVLFEDVVVREAAPGGRGSVALAAADLDIQDFSAEVGESLLHVAASDLLRRVLKTAAANVAGNVATVERAVKQ